MKPGRLVSSSPAGGHRCLDAVVIGLLLLLLGGCGKQAPEYEIIVPVADRIRIPLDTVNDGKVHFYTYKYDGKNVNFFVRTDGGGKLHTHFDACWSCYKYKLGFVVEGDQIRCIACNLKYDLAEEFWDFIGACAPIPVRSRIKEDAVVIELGAVQKGAKFF